MNKILISLLLVILSFTSVLIAEEDDNLNWLTNMEEASAIAAKENKPILVNFTGSDWCGWCIRLTDEVFAKDSFKKYADNNLVLVKLDFPSKVKQSDETKQYNQKWLEKFGVRGFPTILLLDRDLKLVNKTGYQQGGPEAYIKHIKKLLG
jgi:thioredoxin-related protein